GIPTRVSVGFQAGQYSAEEELYRVRGADAHAWPEILLEDVGWLRFEPTPGRGAPGDEVYTNNTPTSIIDDPSIPSPATSIAPPVSDREFSPGDIDPIDETNSLDPTSTPAPINDSFSIPTSVILGFLGILLAIVTALGLVLALKARHRAKRLAVHADENRRQIAEAWLIAEDHLSMAGFAPKPAETPLEYGARVSTKTRIIKAEINSLAELVSNARFAVVSPSDSDVEIAQKASAKIADSLNNSLSWLDRSRYALDIRPLLPAQSTIDET
ncbi:MAG: transglutaminase domain-containing protein, partial [Acidimicrobiales bacterium]